MAFTLENAVVEFSTSGLSQVMAAAAKATSAVQSVPNVEIGVDVAEIARLEAAIVGLRPGDAGFAELSMQLDAAIQRANAFGQAARKAVSATSGAAPFALSGVTLAPVVNQAEQIEQRLRAAVAELARLQSAKLAGTGGPDIEAQLAKARGAVGGLTASLARFTGNITAEVASAFGVIPPKADAATAATNRAKSALGSLNAAAMSARSSVSSAFSSMASSAAQLAGSFSGVKASLLGIVGIGSFGALAGSSLKLAASAETLQISFETLLGSAAAAKGMVSDLQRMAAETPLSEMGVSDAAKKMLAFGFAAESVIPMLTTVGDAATSLAGGGAAGEEALQGIIRALGQMRGKGKVQAEEIMQLAERGIPAWDMLAEAMGTSVADVQKQVTAGTVSAQVGIDAITSGMEQRFGGGMKRMSQTSEGLFSTLIDSMRSVGRNIGAPFQPFVKSALKAAIEATSSLQAVLMPSVEVIRKALGKEVSLNLNADSVAAFGNRLAGFTQSVVDAVATAKEWLGGLSPSVLSMSGAFAAAMPMVGGLLTTFSLFSPMLGPMKAAFGTLAPAIGLLASPLGLVSAGVAGLGAALLQNESVAKSFASATESAVGLVTDAWSAAIEIGGELWSEVSLLFAELKKTDAWKAVASGVSGTLDWIGALVNDVAFMARNWREAGAIVKESIGLMWDNAKQAFSNIGQNFFDFIAALESFANGDGFNFQWTGLTEGFQNSTKEMESAVARMAANEEKRLRDQANKQKAVVNDEVAAVAEGEQKKKDIKTGAADAAADAAKKATSKEINSWSDVADRMKATASGLKSDAAKQELSAGRATGEAADKAMIDTAAAMNAERDAALGLADALKGVGDAHQAMSEKVQSGEITRKQLEDASKAAWSQTGQGIELSDWTKTAGSMNAPITQQPSDRFGFSDGMEGMRRQAEANAGADAAAIEMTSQATPDEQAHKLLEAQSKLLEKTMALMDRLVQAATSTGLKIEPQTAVVG
jgi:tape measure domain-containing protein